MIRSSEPAGRSSAAALAEIADLPYFRVDADRNVTEMSPAMERLTGFRAADAVGHSCLNIHRCEECLGGCGVFDNRTVLDRHLELYRADGSTIRVRKSGRVFVDGEGRITGAIEVVRPLDEAPLESTEDATAAPLEIDAIRAALAATRYRRTDAARGLGMSRTTLWRKMREYGL